MGFIKAIGASASSQLHDIYRELLLLKKLENLCMKGQISK